MMLYVTYLDEAGAKLKRKLKDMTKDLGTAWKRTR